MTVVSPALTLVFWPPTLVLALEETVQTRLPRSKLCIRRRIPRIEEALHKFSVAIDVLYQSVGIIKDRCSCVQKHVPIKSGGLDSYRPPCRIHPIHWIVIAVNIRVDLQGRTEAAAGLMFHGVSRPKASRGLVVVPRPQVI